MLRKTNQGGKGWWNIRSGTATLEESGPVSGLDLIYFRGIFSRILSLNDNPKPALMSMPIRGLFSTRWYPKDLGANLNVVRGGGGRPRWRARERKV
jgi:hypothetical protein